MSRSKEVASVFADDDTDDPPWRLMATVAEIADVPKGIASATLQHLNSKGLLDKRPCPDDGNKAEYRVLDREALLLYLDGTRPNTQHERSRDGFEKNRRIESLKLDSTPPAIGSLADMFKSPDDDVDTPAAEDEPSANPEGRTVKRLEWAVDHTGRLVLCMDDTVKVLPSKQWVPLARMLKGLLPCFSGAA